MPTLSRQRSCQNRKTANGQCALCTNPLFYSERCVDCYRKSFQWGKRGEKRSSGALGVILLNRHDGLPLADNPIGELMRNHRADNLISVRKFSRKSGLSVNTIQAYEAGRTSPKHYRALTNLAASLGIKAEALFKLL